MTGILPIIKVEAQSALNNFLEYSIIDPGETAKYYGFTEDEVKAICEKNLMDFALMKHTYDGYIIGNEKSMFNPNSVMLAVEMRNYNSHWSKSASYTIIEHYIEIDHDNVRDKIIRMLNGERVILDSIWFRCSLSEITNCDSVLAFLVTFGYLAYDDEAYLASVPNQETAELLKEMYNVSSNLVGINWSKRKAKHDVKIEVIEG